MKIARGTQRAGQTREQTKLIAQGIRKGIELYKKQQSARTRELDKKRKQARRHTDTSGERAIEVQAQVVYRQHWLPWVLLIFSWLAMAAYWLFS